MTDKAGLYDLLHIPDPLRIGFVTIAAILVLSVLMGEKDFGLLKVPAMPWLTRRWLRFVAPAALLLAVSGFVPFFRVAATATGLAILTSDDAEVHFIADDLTFRLSHPYEQRQVVLSAQVRVEVASGLIALTRQAELISSQLNRDYFAPESYTDLRLLSAKPDKIVVPRGGQAMIALDFDTSSLIPRSSYVTDHEAFAGKPFGSLKVSITYTDRKNDKKAVIEIPMRFAN
jgi:hypothetical protein